MINLSPHDKTLGLISQVWGIGIRKRWRRERERDRERECVKGREGERGRSERGRNS